MPDAPRPVHVPWGIRLAAGILMVLALFLCGWQLRRHGERNAGREAALAVEGRPALGEADRLTPDAAWRNVRWQGRFEGRPELIGGRMEGERLGYGVAQYFRRAGGELLLVDRGWVPASAVAAAVSELGVGGPAELVGQARPVFGSTTSVSVSGHGTRIWPAKAWPSLLETAEASANRELYVVAAPSDERSGQGETVPRGGVVGVPPRDDTSLHYASQWAGIAALLAIVLVPGAMTRARHFLGA